jgi:phospholipid N-methyltransferase
VPANQKFRFRRNKVSRNERKLSIFTSIFEKSAEGRRYRAVLAGIGGENDRRHRARRRQRRSYLGIELDKNLVKTLNRNFEDLKITAGNACDAYAIHKKSGLGKIGYIICCLPFVSLPNEVGERILMQVDRFMQKGCTFRTFQYAHGYYMPSAIKLREFMRNHYGKSRRSKLIVKNVPPAYTLTWKTN